MPGHKIRLSLSSRFFSSSTTPTTPTTSPSSEDFPATPRSSTRHKARPSLSKFFRLSLPPTSPIFDFSKSQLPKSLPEDQLDKAQPIRAAPVRRQTEPTPAYTQPVQPLRTKSTNTPPLLCRPPPRRAVTSVFHRHENRCLQALSPRIFVAFEDDMITYGVSQSEDLRSPSGAPFDHIIRITSHPRRVPGRALDIYLTPRPHTEYVKDMETLCKDPETTIHARETRVSSLSLDQLVMARDYIFQREGTVLITTPRDARVEAMTLAIAFLAYSSGYGARQIYGGQNARTQGFKSVWQYTLSEPGLELVKKVAAKRAVYCEDLEGLRYHHHFA